MCLQSKWLARDEPASRPHLAYPNNSRSSSSTSGWLARTVIPRYGDTVPPQRSSTITTKARTLRLPIDQAKALEAIAGVDEVSVNEEIRRAIATHIEARRQDADFQKRLQDSIDRNKEILERLAR